MVFRLFHEMWIYISQTMSCLDASSGSLTISSILILIVITEIPVIASLNSK